MRFITTVCRAAMPAALLALLGGCASFNIDAVHKLAFNSKSEDYPSNYRQLIQRRLGYARPTNLLVSQPKTMIGTGAFDAQRWFVCLRNPVAADKLLILSKGEISGEIADPAPEFCVAAQYEPLG